MEIVNFSEARNNFKAVLDRVAKSRTVIVRRDAEDAVLMSKSHYDSLMETFYLLKIEEARYKSLDSKEHKMSNIFILIPFFCH